MQTATTAYRPSTPFRTHDPRLEPIAAKVLAGERLDFNDGLVLYGSTDVLAVGWLANHVRERMHGDVTYFNVNRHINPTNVCVANCKLCAFGRKKGDPAGYTMALEEAWQTAASGYSEAVTEFHIVGGLHPDLPLEYFLDLVRGLKQRFPKVHIKAFTMVEVAFLARRAKLTIEQTLTKMREAGVDSMPGGGAEIFAERVRSIICDHKIDGEEWITTARLAHRLDRDTSGVLVLARTVMVARLLSDQPAPLAVLPTGAIAKFKQDFNSELQLPETATVKSYNILLQSGGSSTAEAPGRQIVARWIASLCPLGPTLGHPRT